MAYLGSFESKGQQYRREAREAKKKSSTRKAIIEYSSSDRRLAGLTQAGKTGVPVIVQKGETTEQAIKRSAERTAELVSRSRPRARRVSVSLTGRDLTSDVAYRTKKFVPVATSIQSRPSQSTGGTIDLYPDAPTETQRDTIRMQNLITGRSREIVIAKEARTRGAFNLYRDDTKIVGDIPVARPEEKKTFFTWYSGAERKVSDTLFPYRESRGGRVLDPFSISQKLPFDVKESAVKQKIRTRDTHGIATGIRREVTEKPISTGAMFVGGGAVRAGYSGIKLGVVKLAFYAPKLQKLGGVTAKAGKALSYGLGGAYGGSVGYNIGTSPEGVGVASGREIVRSTALFSGFGAGGKLVRPVDTKIATELGFQKFPRAKSVATRQEFFGAKKELSLIRKGAVAPRELDFTKVEKLDTRAAGIVKRFSMDYKGDVVVGGSLSSRTQVRTQRLLGKSGDVDFYTDRPELSKVLLKNLKAGGVDAYGSGKLGTKIYIRGMGKAVEFNPLSEKGMWNFYPKRLFTTPKDKTSILETNIRSVSSPFRSWRSGIVRTPSGVGVTSLRIQAARKLYGGYEVTSDKLGRVYMYRYSKDIPDYYALKQATGIPKTMSPSTTTQFFGQGIGKTGSFNIKGFTGKATTSPALKSSGFARPSTSRNFYKSGYYSNIRKGFEYPYFTPRRERGGYYSPRATSERGGALSNTEFSEDFSIPSSSIKS